MRITTLVENNPLEGREDLTAEFGLSLHVDTGTHRVLFDTGTSGVFASNAEALGVDISAVDAAVLSHHHFDHGGGLGRFLQINDGAKVYLRGGEVAPRWFKALGVIKRPIGIDTTLFERYPERFEFLTEDTEILPGVFLLTEIGSAHSRPRGNRRLFAELGGSLVPDPFDHELVMVIRKDDGMVVFTGCSHNGVLNMVDAAAGRFPGVGVRAVVGGFHLGGTPPFNTLGATRPEVEEIGRQLLTFEPDKVYTAHCTGEKAYRELAEVMGDVLAPFHTGTQIEV